MIEVYTVGKLQIARDRIYNTVEQGGLGLLKIDMLGISMGCAVPGLHLETRTTCTHVMQTVHCPRYYIWYTVLCTMPCVLVHRAHIPGTPKSCWCNVLIAHKLSPQPIWGQL